MQPTSVANQVIPAGYLETGSKASTQLQDIYQYCRLIFYWVGTSYRRMIVPRPRINNADLDTLTKDAPVVKLTDTRGIVRRIVTSGGGISNGCQTLDRREGNTLVGPGTEDPRNFQQTVDIVVVCLDARAREDIRLKVLDDLDIGSKRNVAAGLARALGKSVSFTGAFPEV